MDELVKIVVYVPESHAERIRQALADNGAGRIGRYSQCSFSSKGISRFKPEEGSDPSVGEIGKVQEVVEEKIEVGCRRSQVTDILAALKEAHPYEEFVVDVYPMLVIEN